MATQTKSTASLIDQLAEAVEAGGVRCDADHLALMSNDDPA